MRFVTQDAGRAARLRAAVEAMPPGPSRERFADLAASLDRPAAAPPATPTPARRLGWSVPAAETEAPAFDPFARSQFAARGASAPERLLPLDDEVLPDDDVLPSGDVDEVPLGRWRVSALPLTPWPADDVAEGVDEPPEETDPDPDDGLVEADPQQRAPLRIPADRPNPASERSEPPQRQRRWRRRPTP